MNDTDLSLGKYIRELRDVKRLSLLEVSTRTNIGYSHLSRIENESTIPGPETIVKLAEALNGDLTLMLQKANNLPRVILDRLIERDKAVSVQTLRRSIPGSSEESTPDEAITSLAIEAAKLSEQDVADLREAINGLVALQPHARRAVMQLISILRDNEGADEPT